MADMALPIAIPIVTLEVRLITTTVIRTPNRRRAAKGPFDGLLKAAVTPVTLSLELIPRVMGRFGYPTVFSSVERSRPISASRSPSPDTTARVGQVGYGCSRNQRRQ
jgi:hypothetical protein